MAFGAPTFARARSDALTSATATQRILAIADDPTMLKRLADAIQAGGASPVLVRGAQLLEQAPGPLPFRFAVYAGTARPKRSLR
jgi:hypothetical protein